MGFAASQGRLSMLVGRKTDLELRLQLIQQQRLFWSDVTAKLASKMAQLGTLDPGSRQVRAFDAIRANIAQRDKQLEMDAQRLDHQREAVTTEIQAVKKVISKNIQQSFSLMGNA